MLDISPIKTHIILIISKGESSVQSISDISAIINMSTDTLEDDREHHEELNAEDEDKEPEIVMRTDAIGHPRTVVVVDTHASPAYFAVPRSIRSDELC